MHGTPREHASTWVISGAARGVGDLRMSLRNKPSEQHRRTLLRARACVSNELRRIPHRSMLIKQVMAYIAYNEASHVKGFKTIFFTRPNVRYRLAQARSRSPYACSTLPTHWGRLMRHDTDGLMHPNHQTVCTIRDRGQADRTVVHTACVSVRRHARCRRAQARSRSHYACPTLPS